MHKLRAALVVVLLGVTGCTAGQVHAVAQALGVNLTPYQESLVARHYSLAEHTDCNTAMRQVWPSRLWGWATTVIWRESRNQPGAGATHASKGCFQLQLPLHNDLFYVVGCNPGMWANPYCNAKAAWLLYQGSGSQPWALTRP